MAKKPRGAETTTATRSKRARQPKAAAPAPPPPPARWPRTGPTTVAITSPAPGATLSSPLAIVSVRYEHAVSGSATLTVGRVRHIVGLDAPSGQLRENVTLLEGPNHLTVELDGARHEVDVAVAPSRSIVISAPALDPKTARAVIGTRATDCVGSYEGASCPAGVVAVNGFMQQFVVPESRGELAEKIVLQAGVNHLAVQIGELYATRLVEATFDPAKLVVTLVWDTPHTDLDLYVIEPSGGAVWYKNKSLKSGGQLDVDRRDGFGPENYSLGGAAPPGAYRVRVHYFDDRGTGRTEWTARVITDEATPGQQRQGYYGILDGANGANLQPAGEGADWSDVCTITIAADGTVSLGEQRPTYYGAPVTSKRVTFIVDVSGSMDTAVSNDKGESIGSRLAVCQRELAGVIKALAADAHFNLVEFDSGFTAWKPQLQPARPEIRKEALGFVAALTTKGCTNVYDPLAAALGDPAVDTVYLLSDGEPNEGRYTQAADIAHAVRRLNHGARVTIHTISVGRKSDLMRRLAEDNGGRYLER